MNPSAQPIEKSLGAPDEVHQDSPSMGCYKGDHREEQSIDQSKDTHSTLSGVSRNVLNWVGGYASPPAILDLQDDATRADAAAWLDTATILPLNSVPSSAAATALVDALTTMVISRDTTRRGPKRLQKLAGAVGAIVGGLLKQWTRTEPRPAFRSLMAASFSDGPVGHRQFTAAMDSLVALALVATQSGFRHLQFDWGDSRTWGGKAARFWPSAELLRLAADHGVTAGSVALDFTAPAPTKPPKVPQPIVVHSLKRTNYRTHQSTKHRLPVTTGTDWNGLRREVEEVNAFAAQHDVRGCLPPRWKRVFTATKELGGRWIAVGKESVYRRMPEAERPTTIVIDGVPVAEIDVRSSQLAIVLGLLRLPLPDDDLYAIDGYPRDVVKQWIVAALGKGSMVTAWSRRLQSKDPKLFARVSAYPAWELGFAICSRYPFLRNPARELSGPAGLTRWEHIGKPQTLLPHRLMGIEAEALTLAMRWLRCDWRLLALPLHDGLLVPRDAVHEAVDSLQQAFQQVARVRPKVTVDAPEGVPATAATQSGQTTC